MKKWIALALLAGLLGGGLWLRARYRAASEVAAPDALREYTPAEIIRGLRDEDPKVRMDALAQLDELDAPELREAVLGALASPHAPARLGVLGSLGPLVGDGEVVEALLGLAREDEDPDVRKAAFRALTATGDTRVLDVAVEVLSSTEAPLAARVLAAKTLDRLTGRGTAEDVAGRLEAAEEAADMLSMDWDDWLSENRARLAWDEAAGRFGLDDK